MSTFISQPCETCKTSTTWQAEINGHFGYFCPLCTIATGEYPISQFIRWIQDFSNQTLVRKMIHKNSLEMGELNRIMFQLGVQIKELFQDTTEEEFERLSKLNEKRLEKMKSIYFYQINLLRLLRLVAKEV